MNIKKSVFAIAAASLLSMQAHAQSNNASDVQRDVNQQQRIENGLQSGQLNTREAGELEHQQAHVDHMEQAADRNGSISPQEQIRINAAQDRSSQTIAAAKHNDIHGNPVSNSSQRMQADVQRNVNQQQRIENGVQSGALTHREAGKLEQGQSADARAQSRAAANGHVGAGEQQHLQARESRQSQRVYNQKHNARHHA